MWWIIGILVVLAAVILFEYRIRRPDQIVLYESRGVVKSRKARFYPRHFSLSIPAHVHSSILEISVEAQGKLGAMVRMDVSVAASPDHLQQLIRAGGWQIDAVDRALDELKLMVQSLVRRYAEKYEMEELTTEQLSTYLQDQIGSEVDQLGLEIISINVQTVEPVDEEIANAMRKRESARILEQTEQINQRARVSASRARVEADEDIAVSEHNLELKRLELQETEEEQEAALARQRTSEELERRRMQLDVDREEIDMLRKNPELLVLNPQVARLAEASQSLKNARTVVSLSGSDLNENSPIIQMLQKLLRNVSKAADNIQTANQQNS